MRTTALSLLAALLVAGCSDIAAKVTPTEPDGGAPSIASIEVSKPGADVGVGQTTQLTATARTAEGAILPGVGFSWASDRLTVARVDANTGVVTGVAAGSATISASAGGKTGSATVSVSAAPANPTTGIAYIRGSEIHLIAPDGTGDRVLWSSPAGPPISPVLLPVSGVTWRPDGRELVFASDHEQAYSWFENDIYAIRPDGSGLRRITNPPAKADLGSFRTGTIKVTVSNGSTNLGPFVVYAMGASAPQTVLVPPGDAETLTFKVADLGTKVLQPVVAIFGEKRWFAALAPDVVAGTTVDAGLLSISSSYARDFGAFGPLWRVDGSNIAFILNPTCTIDVVADQPVVGPTIQALLDPKVFTGFCAYDRGRTPATASKLLIASTQGSLSSIYLVTEGATSLGSPILSFDDYNWITLVHWLPDASGFLVSMRNGLSDDNVDLYEYDFPSGPLRRITDFRNSEEHLRAFSISPDGSQIVYEWRTTSMFAGGPNDLYVMNRNGSGQRLLVRDASYPSWSPVAR